jgi:hypothetical protein
MVVVRPIRISPRARDLCRERAEERCIALQFREIRSGGCCAAGAAVSAVLLERKRLAGGEWIDLGEWDGVPVVAHRALLPFLEGHPLEIDAGGLWPFRGLKLRSDVDIDMWCMFGDRPFAPPEPEWD